MLIGWILAALTLGSKSQGAPIPTAPLLRLDAGSHTSAVYGVSVDPKGRFLITCSLDKTARVWSLPDLKLLRTLRPPGGTDAEEGKLYTEAISPDGSTVAVAGCTGYSWDRSCSVYLFDIATGKLVRRLTGMGEVVSSLEFSADGRLAAGMISGGIKVFDPASGKLDWEDGSYPDHVYGLSFAPDGKLAVASLDRKLRIYDPSGAKLVDTTCPPEISPRDLRYSPDGSELAISDLKGPLVEVLDSKTLQVLSKPDASGLIGPVGQEAGFMALSWSLDGKSLYAAGAAAKANQGFVIRRWTKGANAIWLSPVDKVVALNTILALAPLSKGAVAFAASDGFGTVSDAGDIYRRALPVADLRDMAEGFLVDEAGERLRFGFSSFDRSPATFSVPERVLQMSTADLPTWGKHSTIGDLPIKDWQESTSGISYGGTPLQLERYEHVRSAAQSADGAMFAIGSDWYLRGYRKNGTPAWREPVEGIVWNINITPNGKLLVAALGNGLLRWFRLSDGKPLLTLFPYPDGRRWVLWSPEGYYDCSPGGDDLMGWAVNNGADHESEFFPASRFHDQYYRPDVISLILKAGDVDLALSQANAAASREAAPGIAALLPPVVRILSRSQGGGDDVQIQYSVKTPTGSPVTHITILVDGRPSKTEQGLNVVAKDQETTMTTSAKASPGSNITLIAYDAAEHASEPAATELTARAADVGPAPAPAPALKGRMVALVVGVAAYNPQAGVPNLAYCEDDAKALGISLADQKGKLYTDVVVKSLIGKEATLDNIQDGIDWLQKETHDHPEDTALLYLAGHGGTDPSSNYYFLPYSFESGHISRTALTGDRLVTAVRSVRARFIVCLDTCHSGWALGGSTDVNGIVNQLGSSQNGAVVLTACSGAQVAYEDRAFDGHGAFTKALLDALSGKEGDRILTIRELDHYLYDQVKQMTGGRQTADMVKPGTIDDFPVAVFSSGK